jgi:hypothetical protein
MVMKGNQRKDAEKVVVHEVGSIRRIERVFVPWSLGGSDRNLL